MFRDQERDLFHGNLTGCPAHSAGSCSATKVSKGDMSKCDNPEDCPIMYWLKVTGILKLGIFPMDLPKDPAPASAPGASEINQNNRLNGAGR